jgi:hypothetical protein
MIRVTVGILIAVAASDLIGSGLKDGVGLVYESGGTAQAPWIYDSVRVMSDDPFDRCVMVGRRGQPARASCARGDTLFDRVDDGSYRPARPIGENMEVRVPGRSGMVLTFTTGVMSTRRIQGREVRYLATTIITRDSAGVVTRRLMEQYAPSLLTALSGTFETPEPAGGWRVASQFALIAVLDSVPTSK